MYSNKIFKYFFGTIIIKKGMVMLQKFFMAMALISSITISLSATNCNTNQFSYSTYAACSAWAKGSGGGAGLGMFFHGYEKKEMTPQEYLKKCVDSFKEQNKYGSKFERIYVNSCLSSVGLRLK